MRSFPWHFVLIIATAVSVIGYPKAANATTVDVTIGPNGNLAFSPSDVTIRPGDKVKWTWGSSGRSTRSGSPGMPNGIWDSGIQSQGTSFTHTFNSSSDGDVDIALFNPATRQTVIGYLSGGTLIGAALGPTLPVNWQLVGAADFNGDGPPDYLLYRPDTRQTAIWHLNNNVFMSAVSGLTLPSGWTLLSH